MHDPPDRRDHGFANHLRHMALDRDDGSQTSAARCHVETLPVPKMLRKCSVALLA
jgi:hypothetical protein